MPPIASTEPTEPYAPLHDATPIVSRADRKADAKSRLNYVLKRIGGRSDRRGRQLFRDGFPDTDSDATPCTVVCSATQPGTPRRTWLTKSSDDFIVDQALPMNASVIDPPGSTFVTTMVASSGDRYASSSTVDRILLLTSSSAEHSTGACDTRRRCKACRWHVGYGPSTCGSG